MMLYILLISLAVLVLAILLGCVFGYTKNTFYRKSVCAITVVSIILGISCCVTSNSLNSTAAELQEQYDNIKLYQDVVITCDDEEVRFGHYEKIKSFNSDYLILENKSENFWIGNLLKDGWTADMDTIEFPFRGM